jgi:hypothetical protein
MLLMLTLINPDEAEFLFKEEYSSAFNKWSEGQSIYRNCQDFGDMFTAEPIFRTSSDTSNEYTILISELLPSWGCFPKRNHCFIGSTYSSIADEYSGPKRHTYCAFPLNRTEIALCSNKDMWDSFPSLERETGICNMNAFNKTLSSFLSELLTTGNSAFITEVEISELFNKSNITDIKNIFEKAGEILKASSISNLSKFRINNIPSSVQKKFLYFFYNGVVKEDKSFTDVLDELLSPSKNGFSKLYIENYDVPAPVEIWFEGKCLFVKAEKMNDGFIA